MARRLPVLDSPRFDGCLTTLRYSNKCHCFDIYKFTPWHDTILLEEFKNAVTPSLYYVIAQLYTVPCKQQLCIKCLFYKNVEEKPGCFIRMTKTMIQNTKQARVFHDVDAFDFVTDSFETFDKYIDKWSEHGSGWVLEKIINITLRISLVKIICGSEPLNYHLVY